MHDKFIEGFEKEASVKKLIGNLTGSRKRSVNTIKQMRHSRDKFRRVQKGTKERLKNYNPKKELRTFKGPKSPEELSSKAQHYGGLADKTHKLMRKVK